MKSFPGEKEIRIARLISCLILVNCELLLNFSRTQSDYITVTSTSAGSARTTGELLTKYRNRLQALQAKGISCVQPAGKKRKITATTDQQPILIGADEAAQF